MSDFEYVIKNVGEFGAYQQRIYVIVCLLGIAISFQTVGITFWASTPQYHCKLNKTLGNISDCGHYHQLDCKNAAYTSALTDTGIIEADDTGHVPRQNQPHSQGNLFCTAWTQVTLPTCVKRAHQLSDKHCLQKTTCSEWEFEKNEGETIVSRVSLRTNQSL